MAVSLRRRFLIFIRDKFTCLYCGRKAPEVRLEVDHRQPRSKGGKDHDSNLVTACYECNRGKGALMIPQPYHSLTAEMIFTLAEIESAYDMAIYEDNYGEKARLEDAESAYEDVREVVDSDGYDDDGEDESFIQEELMAGGVR